MKLLDNIVLTEITGKMCENAIDCTLDFRLEPYSSKMISTDKRSWKHANGTNVNEPQMLSPPDEMPLSHSLGLNGLATFDSHRLRHFSERSLSGSDNDENLAQMIGTISKKTLFNLTQMLNTSFLDYDFSNKKGSSFALVPSYQAVRDSCDRYLSPVVDGYNRFSYALWDAIDDEIKPLDCVIYRYIPSSSEVDPFTEDGVLWHFNYLFHNRNLKRFMMMSCRALHMQNSDEGEADEDWVMD